MGIKLLGPLVVEGDGALRPRDRIVLSALAVRRGQVVSADQLADALWGEGPPTSWPKQVQICVARVRKVVGPAAIETGGGGYRLALSGDDVDVYRFEQLVERGRTLAATDEPDRAASTLARALSLWRGSPFEDLDGWPPGRSETARLEELRRSTAEDLLDARLAAGEHREVAAEAEALVAEEPLRERRWAILALAQYRCGRQADALRSLHMARRTLLDELGIDPGSELVALEAAILRQDADLAAAPSPPAITDACPYKGLAPYDIADTEGFFGRDAEVAACLHRLASAQLLVVAGPSGCGKSSLLRAGLVPALQKQGRSAVVFVPGSDPAAALANATSATDDASVLVIDQFEELFALGNPIEVVAFCRRIVEYSGDRAPVVIAVRADHLAGLAVDAAFSRLVEQGLYLVSPLAGDALRDAIEQPATRAGLRLEPGLIDLLVRDTEGEPGALPLLSHALAETWRRRDGRVLTVEGYRATGGIRGAVARSADRLYESLPPEQRTVLRSVLLRLVAPAQDGEPVRSRVSRRTLGSNPGRERVVGLLVRARLVTAEEETVELAHEALARAWPRLRSWLDEDSDGQRILRHLAAAADGWESLGRPESELYRGARLDATLEWRAVATPDLTATETAFLEASVVEATSERQALAERNRQQARQNRRLRVLLSTAAVSLVVSMIAGLLVVRSGREARDQRNTAQLEALVNRSLALRSTNRAVAALLAVEAHRRAPDDARAHSALLGTFTAAPGFMGYQHLPVDDVPGGVLTPGIAAALAGAPIPGTESAVVAMGGRDLELLNIADGRLEDRFPPADDGALNESVLRVSDDARFVVQLVTTESEGPCGNYDATKTNDGRGCGAFSIYELTTGRRTVGPVTPPLGPGDVAINSDGSLVAVAGGFDGGLAVYRGGDGELLGTLPGIPRPDDVRLFRDTAAVTFGPDNRIYLGSMAGPIRVVDPSAMQTVATYDAPVMSSHVRMVVNADGLLVAGGDQAIVAVDTSTGVTRWSVDIRDGTQAEPCPWLAVSESADRLYCGNYFGVIEERELATGQRTGATKEPQLGSVGDLAVTPDGRELIAFGAQVPVITRWRLDGSGPVTRQVADGRAVADGYDPSGEMLLVARRDAFWSFSPEERDLAVWDPAADEVAGPMPVGALVAAWAGPHELAIDLADGTKTYYDVDAAALGDAADEKNRFPGDAVWARFPADGTRLYVGVFPELGPCEVWTYDTDTRRRIEPTIKVGDCWQFSSISATRDGDLVVITTMGPDGMSTTIHDGGTGERLGEPLPTPAQASTSSVSSDGTLVVAERSGDITEYDLDTRQPVGKFPGARGEVRSLGFSADGTVLLVSSADQTVSIYDVASRTRLGDPIPTNAPFGIAGGWLRPDGAALATTVRSGVAIWDIDPDHLAEAACHIAGRNLTPTEWDTYLGGMGDYRTTCPAFD